MTYLDSTISFSRILPYPTEIIMEKYTRKEALTRWWGPKGNTNTFQTFDFQEGGKWIFIMNDGKINYPNEWIFRKIQENHILMEHTIPHFFLDITLEEISKNETRMTWNATWDSPEILKPLRDFLTEKNSENFDRLEEELENKIPQ